MKDSLLLPVHSNGGNRHSAHQGSHRGEVLTETVTIGTGDNALPEGQSPKDFLETFNNAVQLSDEQQQRMNGETQPRKEGELGPLRLHPDNIPQAISNEETPLSSVTLTTNTEREVDARTALALTHFTETQALGVGVASNIPAQNAATPEMMRSIASGQLLTFETVNTLPSETPLTSEGPLGHYIAITETGQAQTLISEGALQALPLRHSDIGLQNMDGDTRLSLERSQTLDSQQFGTIKGEALPILSIPRAVTTDPLGAVTEQTEPIDLARNFESGLEPDIIPDIIKSDTALTRFTLPTNAPLDLNDFNESANVDAVTLTAELDEALLSLPLTPFSGSRHSNTIAQENAESLILDGSNRGQTIQIEGSPETALNGLEIADTNLNSIQSAATETGAITSPFSTLDSPNTNLEISLLEVAEVEISTPELSETDLNYIKTSTESLVRAETLASESPNISLSNAAANNSTETSNSGLNTEQTQTNLENASIAQAPNDNKLIADESAEPVQDITQAAASDSHLEIDNIETVSIDEADNLEADTAANSDSASLETMPATPPLPLGLGTPLSPLDRAVNENNRSAVSLADLQLGAARQTDPNVSELSRKAGAKEARDIEVDIEREDLPSPTDLRDVDLEPEDIDLSDLMTDAAEADFEAAKSLPPLGQTALSPLAMSTASSPVLQPLMGLGAETLSPLALQSQSAAAASPTNFSQSPALRQAVVSTVSEALLTAKETPKGVVVQLDPPELGRVYIDFLFEGDNNVSVIVKSETADSQAILRERQEYLQSLLKESGFNNVSLSFEQQTGNGDGNAETGEQGKEMNIGLSAPSLEAQAEPYNQSLHQMSNETIRLDMRL